MNPTRRPMRPHRLIGATIIALSLLPELCGSQAVAAHDAAMPQLVDQSAGSLEDRFLADNEAAMAKMMAAMAADPTGDVDRDFVAMMVPHHQGAIAMAVGLLRYGRNERLKRLAQEIIVTQQAEIAAMRQAIGEPLPPSMPSPTTPSAAPAQAAMAMPDHASTMR